MDSYLTPKERQEIETEVKKSRFIAIASHTPNISESKAFIKSVKEQFPDAGHHCYAHIAGSPTDSHTHGFSDDGEPNGTAGKPIFNHLIHRNIGEITLVVIRYFGGTKLGTGGLARAYSDAARVVLEHLNTERFIPKKAMIFACDFAIETRTRKAIEDIGGEITAAEYCERVLLKCLIPVNQELVLPYSVSIESST